MRLHVSRIPWSSSGRLNFSGNISYGVRLRDQSDPISYGVRLRDQSLMSQNAYQ